MTEKRKNAFCYVCRNHAEFVLLSIIGELHPRWFCCCCNPLLLQELIDEFYPGIEVTNED